MAFIYLMFILGTVVIVVSVTTAYSQRNGALRRDLEASRRREEIASRGLREIAAGDAMPVLRASDALTEINKTYNSKEIS